MALTLMAITVAAHSLPRTVIVVAWPDDPLAAEQHAALNHEATALRERDVVVMEITPEVATREKPELAVARYTSFEVLLIGKDGGVKLRSGKPVAASEITALIDTMPMRRAEMRR